MQNTNTISLTIPSNCTKAAQAAASFFNHLVELNGGFDAVDTGEQLPAPVVQQPAAEQPAAEQPAAEQPAAEQPAAEQPAASASEYPITVNGVQVDKDGVTWDARIHSSNKKCRKSDGKWTPKRGVDQNEYDRVTAELKAIASGQQPTQQPAAEQQPTQQPAANVGGAFGNQQPAAQQPAAGGVQISNPADYFQKVAAGGFSQAAQDQVCSQRGWGSLAQAVTAAAQNPNIFSEVYAQLEAARAQGI